MSHALASAWVKISGRAAMVTFDEVAPGTYAVTAFHDANDNRKVDKRWFGLPEEAWGVSNNVRPHVRAPRFDEATFELPGDGRKIEIHVD